jgi:23S rRNA pseudouridine1911/1915/1917 synthase
LVREGHVIVDGLVVIKPSFQLQGFEDIQLHIPEPETTNIIPENIPLEILFENDDIIVINKPPGMVVHPSPGHSSGTLVHAVLAHVPDIEGIGGEKRPGVVHRLDKDTSGVIIMAKNDPAFQFLQLQFNERTVEKIYLSLVEGIPPTPSGRIEVPIGRDPQQRQKMAVVPLSKGREAITMYKTLENFLENAFLEVHPLTGRTHQIRVHLAYIGCPVVGDKAYGRRKQSLGVNRQFLHAEKLIIRIPGLEESATFHAPLPSDLEDVLKKLRTQTRPMGGNE